MKIEFVDIRNFRKLKLCRVAFADNETVFVGPNNSGKTSAMDALILFLKRSRRKDLATTDITLSNWYGINDIGNTWIECDDPGMLNLDIQQWLQLLPSLDIWLHVDESEIHYVSHLIPTLSWAGGRLGVRLSFEPIDIEKLYKEFKNAFEAASMVSSKSSATGRPLSLWPQSMQEFLDRHLHRYFNIRAYLLDPTKIDQPIDGIAEPAPQMLPPDSMPLDEEPFKGLFKINVINAQRGFSDAKTSDSPTTDTTSGRLTSQFKSYFDKHLNPSEHPTENDVDALMAIENAQDEFDQRLHRSFSSAISELETLGYPGFSDPRITLTSKINPVDGLDHDSALRFYVGRHYDDDDNRSIMSLPEKYNGLGYQNLISIVFKLMRFRDEWMRKGKANSTITNEDDIIEPLHIVLIEEPEAHLHAQVQQVFIRKAYHILRNDDNLKTSTKHSTQMIVSTHSSHIAHEIDFGCLRYFCKKSAKDRSDVPCATVVNLSKTFGKEDETSKFATRYLKTTHCDLFFADAVILVEGPAERMLVPHFIRNKYPELDSRYITILEIGGSHSHRLKPLIDELKLITFVITDIDSIKEDSDKKVQPKRNRGYRTSNDTLKKWLPKEKNLDVLFDLGSEYKISENGLVRVAYQCPISVSHFENGDQAIPYTFEDALVFSNIELFRGFIRREEDDDKKRDIDNKKKYKRTGLIKKMSDALEVETVGAAAEAMFKALESGRKAEMALDLLYLDESCNLETPLYIAEGLNWLKDTLLNKDSDYSLYQVNVQ